MKFRTLVSKIFDYRGKTPKKIGYDWNNNGTIIAISAKNIKNQQLINLEKSHRGDERLYQAWMKDGDVKPGDVLLTSEAPLGESYQVKVDERFIISQRIFGLRPNTEVVDVDYFAALIASRKFQKLLGSRATGTTVLGIKQSELLNLDIELPSIETQKKIGVLMRVLNEKIVNEQLINDNLLELAQQIFDSEYLKKQSNYPKIPLYDIVNVKSKTFNPKKTTEKEVIHFSLPAYDSETYPTMDLVDSIRSNKNIIESNTILVSKMNPTTKRVWIPNYVDNMLNVSSTEFLTFNAQSKTQQAFIWAVVDSTEYQNYLISGATGSTGSRQRIKPKDAYSYTIGYNPEVAMQVGEKMLPLLSQVKSNRNEIETLKKLRNTLLIHLIK